MAEPRFLDFLDRIDGGGKGQSGDTFEGGGLLSMLGNLFASPYGAKNPERRARRDAFYAGSPMAATGFDPSFSQGDKSPVRTVSEMRPDVLRQGQQPSAFEALSPARDPYDMMENRYGPAQPAAGTRPDVLTTGQQPSAFEALSPARDLRDMQQSANYAPTTGTQADLFLASLRSQHGPEKAYAIAKSPFARDLFNHYINNNYTLPAM
jgi:hypothetical protein